MLCLREGDWAGRGSVQKVGITQWALLSCGSWVKKGLPFNKKLRPVCSFTAGLRVALFGLERFGWWEEKLFLESWATTGFERSTAGKKCYFRLIFKKVFRGTSQTHKMIFTSQHRVKWLQQEHKHVTDVSFIFEVSLFYFYRLCPDGCYKFIKLNKFAGVNWFELEHSLPEQDTHLKSMWRKKKKKVGLNLASFF